MPFRWFRLRGSGLKRKRGRFFAACPELRPLLGDKHIVPLSEVIALSERLLLMWRDSEAEQQNFEYVELVFVVDDDDL